MAPFIFYNSIFYFFLIDTFDNSILSSLIIWQINWFLCRQKLILNYFWISRGSYKNFIILNEIFRGNKIIYFTDSRLMIDLRKLYFVSFEIINKWWLLAKILIFNIVFIKDAHICLCFVIHFFVFIQCFLELKLWC